MSASTAGAATAVFIACAVEAVEASTVVLAVGSTRGWRWTLAGVAAALLTLGAAVTALGAAVASLPIQTLQLLVGTLLIAIGLQWLRKAVLRAAGRKSLHDEQAVYRETVGAAQQQGRATGVDRYAVWVSYTAVVIEGLEVVLIVLSSAGSGHGVWVGVVAATVAVLLVIVAAFALRAPLARVPENTLKLCVGVMLTSLGLLWGSQGAGLDVTEAVLPGIVLAVLCGALLVLVRLRRAPRPVQR
jgi:uncharacterized membrane protein